MAFHFVQALKALDGRPFRLFISDWKQNNYSPSRATFQVRRSVLTLHVPSGLSRSLHLNGAARARHEWYPASFSDQSGVIRCTTTGAAPTSKSAAAAVRFKGLH